MGTVRLKDSAMSQRLPLADQINLLFAYGEAIGISAAYRTIATATGENATNIRKIQRGENLNPGLKLIRAITRYFHVDLDYFTCTSRPACQQYLSTIAKRKLSDHIEKQAVGISKEAKAYIFTTIDYLRRAEGLPPFGE
jgi:transcriptional regulator with XRE-family HTH domain